MAGIPGWISVSSAARRLRISRQAVYARVRRGSLEARELYGRILVSTASVEAVLRGKLVGKRTVGGEWDAPTRTDQ